MCIMADTAGRNSFPQYCTESVQKNILLNNSPMYYAFE